MIKVLYISAWYPSRYDKMVGLFVQKHAQSISLYCDVKVLYVYADDKINNFEIVKEISSNLTELIVYYPSNAGSIFYKVSKPINYIRAYIKGYKEITKDGFIPDIVHANILTRTGFIAYLHKVWKGTPYIITEHWSRYLPTRNVYKGILRKLTTQFVVKNASAILPVSENLKKAMIDHKLLNNNYVIVNNVVDNYFFTETPISERSKKRIIHVSCFDELSKNISGIIRAVSELSKIRQDFEFIIVGMGNDFEMINNYSRTLNIHPGILQFPGNKTAKEVANLLQNSDLFVLFSNYETAGVVISESLACGKPVLSTKVGAAPEYINQHNGKLIDIGNENELYKEMNYMLDHLDDYDSEIIKKEAKKIFNYDVVGMQITEIYKGCIK